MDKPWKALTPNEKLAMEMARENANAIASSRGGNPDITPDYQEILRGMNRQYPEDMKPFASPSANMTLNKSIPPVPKKEWDGTPYEGNSYEQDSDLRRSLLGAKDAMGRQTHRGMLGGVFKSAKELFGNADKMALLQTGLGMMNPNNYYDNQGFHSTMGGINRALGQGLRTRQALMKPRELGFKEKQRILQNNAKELTTHEAQLKSRYGADSKEWATWSHYKKMLPLNKQNDPDEYLKWKRSYGYLDRGSEHILPSPTGRGEPLRIPKDLPPEQRPETKKAQAIATSQGKVTGETSAQAMIDLPSAERNKTNMLREIDEIINHPDLPNALGMFDQYTNIEGYNADINARITQLTGKNFMNAYQGLKGGGPITDVEGVKAEAAQARLSKAQSPEAFIQALRDLKLIVLETYMGTEEKAGLSKNLNLRRSTDKAPEGNGGALDAKRKRVQELRRKKMENR